ncbi:hypothetical protein QTO34_007592, partial [Cnephaeus nilssonii]
MLRSQPTTERRDSDPKLGGSFVALRKLRSRAACVPCTNVRDFEELRDITKKRRNNGCAKKGLAMCSLFTAPAAPRDKVIKKFVIPALKFVIRNTVQATVLRDISEISIFNAYVLPNAYVLLETTLLCESCHSQQDTVVRNHSREVWKDKHPHTELAPCRCCPMTSTNAH